MSFFDGVAAAVFQLHDWMPPEFAEPGPKVLSLLELTGSLTKVPASARLVLPLVKVPLPGTAVGDPASAKTWSQSCEVVVEPDVPRTPVVALPSSSNVLRRLGRTRDSSRSREGTDQALRGDRGPTGRAPPSRRLPKRFQRMISVLSSSEPWGARDLCHVVGL